MSGKTEFGTCFGACFKVFQVTCHFNEDFKFNKNGKIL